MNHLITTELGQRQTISPQVYQSLRILQMNNLELDTYIKEQMLENPVLDQDEPPLGGAQSLDSLREPVLSWTREEGDGAQHDEDMPPRQLRAPDTGESLREYLTSQFDPDLDRVEVRLLDSILDFVDDAGYLTAGVEEIARMTRYSAEYIGYGVAYLQRLDPLGVCARDLAECLLLQLEGMGYREAALQKMVRNHLEDIASGRFGKIAREVGCVVQEVRRLCDIIKTLHPKPGANFGGKTAPMGLPDVVVTVENGIVTAAVEERGSGRIFISDYYARLAKQDEYGEATAYLEEKLAQAKWVIRAIEGRKSTLGAIADYLALHQSDFFLSGCGKLMPLTLREVAQSLEVHESTVSRAVNGKFLQCRRGTFPLKYFFAPRAVEQENGQSASRNTVKDRIRELIDGEDKRRPLSDHQLMEILGKEGVCLSRRVIAKYRAELCIPPTSARREL